MIHESKDAPGKPTAEQPGVDAAEAKRVAARRRFLRVGGGGSAALVLTVVHKRSFAGMKKGVIASQCTSLQGVADLTGAKHKNPLVMSVGHTPKNMICRQPGDGKPVGNCAEIYPSRYVDQNGNSYLVANGDEINKGCGNLQLTIDRSASYRLYGTDKRKNDGSNDGKPPGWGEGDGGGYCPIGYDALGDLNYIQKNYYKLEKKDGVTITKLVGACKPAAF